MVTLKRISLKNIWELMRLKVREDQEAFVASNPESVLEAFAAREDGAVALPFGIYDGQTPVGFVMFG